MTPAQALRLQALKARLFDDMLVATSDFEDDIDINGADFVEGFARFRETAVKRIRDVGQDMDMGSYIVLFRDHGMSSLEEPLAFPCEAEDGDHAEEQCLNAYPACEVLWVFSGTNSAAAYADYWENDNENQ